MQPADATLAGLIGSAAAGVAEIAGGLVALQDLPLVPDHASGIAGAAWLQANLALQELDRLTQAANALALLLQSAAELPPASVQIGTVELARVLQAVPLESVRSRIASGLCGPGTLQRATGRETGQ